MNENLYGDKTYRFVFERPSIVDDYFTLSTEIDRTRDENYIRVVFRDCSGDYIGHLCVGREGKFTVWGRVRGKDVGRNRVGAVDSILDSYTITVEENKAHILVRVSKVVAVEVNIELQNDNEWVCRASVVYRPLRFYRETIR